MSELVIEPFTNEFGQVINPGDEVIFAGYSGYTGTSIRKGIFAGVRYADVTRTYYLKDENGQYIKEERKNAYNGSAYFVNKSERVTAREVVAVRVEKVNRGHKYKYWTDENGNYRAEKTDEVQYGVSTLPLKRVYKMDTSMASMVNKSF
jgi:hypothetical protein